MEDNPYPHRVALAEDSPYLHREALVEDIRTLVPEVVDNHLRAGMVPGEGHNHLAQVTGSYQVGQVDTQVLRLVGALAGSCHYYTG